jgi:hypothetical protein
MKTVHKFIRIGFISEWSKKHVDRHITPVLSLAKRKYSKQSYFVAIAFEWWCWAVTIGFISFDTKGSHFNYKDFKKSTGYLNVFGKKMF